MGAGISHPPIPLAWEIEEKCKAIAKQYGRTEQPPGLSPLDAYSHWFAKALPNPIQRQRYLRKLIEGKPISQANLRLAHLLLEETITNVVVTTNFDDFIAKALTLFGRSPIVCDHPLTVERIDPEQDDLQIIHVHGTYWFYDCCNLRGEIEQRAQPSVQTTLTMASLLDYILSHRSPLVIGYGGWEGDVIMTALQRRLHSRLPYNLYWFCYRQAQLKSLPDWLKIHPDVYFVVPPEQTPRGQPVAAEPPERIGRPEDQVEMPSRVEARGLLENEGDIPTLPAQQVFDKLIRTFGLKAPNLTSDPLGFFSKHLGSSLPQEDALSARKAESDIYYIRSVIERIDRAKRWETETVPVIEPQLERIRDAMRRSQYREAIELGAAIALGDLTETQLRELMDAMDSAAFGLDDNSEEEIKGYELVNAVGGILLDRNPDDPLLREQVARALERLQRRKT
ncbi:MAG: SIR2 family protein [Deltaproteobacteria bacterium]|nr:SIR2 family protein [Deltaproteobacteria bacterium]